jgi:hypothetical protein
LAKRRNVFLPKADTANKPTKKRTVKKIRNLLSSITLALLLVLAGNAPGILAQEPNEEVKDEVSSAQLPPPMIELAGQIGGTVSDTWWVNNVSVMGNMAYVSADDGLHLIDISTPARPTQTGFYPTMGGAGEIVLIGNIAGVLNGDLVLFINVANPAALSEVGSYSLPFSGFPDYAQDIVVVGHTAYVVRFVTGCYRPN